MLKPACSTAAVWRRRVAVYGFAIAITILTLQTRLSLTPWLGERPVLILFILPIIFSAYLGGLGPGLLSTALCAGSYYYFFVAKAHNILFFEGSVDLWQLVMLLIVGGLVSLVVEALHRSRQQIETGSRLRLEEEKKAEQAVRERERLLQQVIDLVPHFIFAKNRDSRILFVNRAYAEANGLAAEEMTSRCNLDFVTDKEQAEVFMRDDREVIDSGKPKFIPEERLTTKDGRLRMLETIKMPFTMPGSNEPALLGVAVDITGRKLAEERFTREQARFKLIFDTIPIGIAFHTVHPDGSLTRIINDAHLRICGITRSQHDEPGIYERITHPDDRDLRRPFQAEVEAGLRKQYSLEKRYVHADGKVVWVNFSYQRETYPDGTCEELTTVTDITERKLDMSRQKMLEEQLRQAQKMEAIGQLAGGVAHDFNNIMAVIQMQVELFRMDGKVSDEQAAGLNEIQTAADRGANLTRQLLLFSRRQRLEPRDLDLSDSIAGMTKMLRRVLGEDIQIHFKYAPEPLFIHADAGMMDQVLMNLTLNSRDAMPDGGQLTIETAAVEFDELAALQTAQARPGPFARLSVRDTGCGIRPEILPRIFEPFFTTKDVGKGTGLGLATVFSIVQQHRGWINVASTPGGGTTFDIYYPRLARNSMSATATTVAPPPAVAGGNETILLVEDDDALRASVRRCLSQLGYRLLEASSGTAALRVWQQHRGQVHLLLTDLIMPGGMTGKELGECLRRENPQLKVIYVSGYSADLLTEDFRPTPGTTFLAKPFPAQALARAVRGCLDKK